MIRKPPGPEPGGPGGPGEPPPRWPRDSPQEDFEARRADELGKLSQWAAGQPARPLTDALEHHGVQRGNPGGDDWPGPLILPDWWDDVAEPAHACPWCQRPVPAVPCPECRQARRTAGDDPQLWAWWGGLAAAQRRLHIAARFGTDPWSGRHCIIRMEWTAITASGEAQTTRPRYFGAIPDGFGIYWGARRQG